MKIATAITKFMIPLISYPTSGIWRRVLMIYVNNTKTTPLTTKLTSPKKRKKRGRESILSIGRIVTFIPQRIIPHRI